MAACISALWGLTRRTLGGLFDEKSYFFIRPKTQISDYSTSFCCILYCKKKTALLKCKNNSIRKKERKTRELEQGMKRAKWYCSKFCIKKLAKLIQGRACAPGQANVLSPAKNFKIPRINLLQQLPVFTKNANKSGSCHLEWHHFSRLF